MASMSSLQPMTMIRSRSGFESLNGATGTGGRGAGGGGVGGGGVVAAGGTNEGHVDSEVGAGNGGASVPPFVTVVVLLAGVVGGLVLVLSVIVCCKYCLPSKPALQKRSSETLSTDGHGRYRHSSSSSSRHRINPKSHGAAMQLCLPPHPVVTCSPQTYSEMMMAPSAPTNGMGGNGGSLKSPQVLETIDFQIISETPFLKQCLGERQHFTSVQDEGTKSTGATRVQENVTIEIVKGEDSRGGSLHDSSLEFRLQSSSQGDSQRQGGLGLEAGLERGHLGTGEGGESGAMGDGSISYDEDSSAVSELTPMLSVAGQDAFHSPNRKEQLCVTDSAHQRHHQRHPHRSSTVPAPPSQPQQPESHKREVFVEVYPTPRSSAVCSGQSTASRTELFRGIHAKSFSDQEISRLTRDRRVQQFILLEVFSVALFKSPKPCATDADDSTPEVPDHTRSAATDATTASVIPVIPVIPVNLVIPSPAHADSVPPAASPSAEFKMAPPCAAGGRHEKRNESMPELWRGAEPCSETLRPYTSDTRLVSPKSRCPLHHLTPHHHQHPYHREHLTLQQQLKELKKLPDSTCSQPADNNSHKVEVEEVVVQRVEVPLDLWQLRAMLANESEADSDESEGNVELTSVELADFLPQVAAVVKESRITPGTPSSSSKPLAPPTYPVCCSQIDHISSNALASISTCQSAASDATVPKSNLISCIVSPDTVAGRQVSPQQPPLTSDAAAAAVDDSSTTSTLPDQLTATPATTSDTGEPFTFGTIAEKEEESTTTTGAGATEGDPLHREPSIRRQTYRKAIAKRQRRHDLLQPTKQDDDALTDTESSLSLEKSASIPAASTSVESFRDSTTSTDSTGENHAYRLEQLRGDSGYKSLETQQSLGTRFDFRQTYFVPEEGSIIREDEPVSPLPQQSIGKVGGGGERRTTEAVFSTDAAVALLSKISPSSMPAYLCYPHSSSSGATKRTLKSKAAEKKRSQYKSDRQAVQVYDSVHEQEPASGGTSTVTSHHQQHVSSLALTGSPSTVTAHHHGPAVTAFHQLSSTVTSHHHHHHHHPLPPQDQSIDAGSDADGGVGGGGGGKQSTKSSSSSLFSRLLKSHSRRPLMRMQQRDYSIDERSDALFNEFIRHDPNYDTKQQQQQRTLSVATARSPRSGHRQHRTPRSSRSSTDQQLPGQRDSVSSVTAALDGPSTAAAASSAELRRRRHEARRRRHDAPRDLEDSAAPLSVTDCASMLDALNRKTISDIRTTKSPDDEEEKSVGDAVEGISEMGKLTVGMVGGGEESSSPQLVPPGLSPGTVCQNRNIPLIQLTEDEDL